MIYLTFVVALAIVYLPVPGSDPAEWCGASLRLAGEKLVKVPEVKLELCERYGGRNSLI
jgi:hypothetical protein